MKKKDLDKKVRRLSINIEEKRTWEEIRATKKDELEREVRRMEEIQLIIMQGLKEEERELEKLYNSTEYNPYILEGDRDLDFQSIHHGPTYLIEGELKYYKKRRGEIRGYDFYDDDDFDFSDLLKNQTKMNK